MLRQHAFERGPVFWPHPSDAYALGCEAADSLADGGGEPELLGLLHHHEEQVAFVTAVAPVQQEGIRSVVGRDAWQERQRVSFERGEHEVRMSAAEVAFGLPQEESADALPSEAWLDGERAKMSFARLFFLRLGDKAKADNSSVGERHEGPCRIECGLEDGSLPENGGGHLNPGAAPRSEGLVREAPSPEPRDARSVVARQSHYPNAWLGLTHVATVRRACGPRSNPHERGTSRRRPWPPRPV